MIILQRLIARTLTPATVRFLAARIGRRGNITLWDWIDCQANPEPLWDAQRDALGFYDNVDANDMLSLLHGRKMPCVIFGMRLEEFQPTRTGDVWLYDWAFKTYTK